MRGVFANQFKRDTQRAAFAIFWKKVVKGHAVEFEHFIPSGIVYKRYNLPLVHWTPKTHNPVHFVIQKHPEVQAAGVGYRSAVMNAFNKWNGNFCRNNFNDYILRSTHCDTKK